MKAAKKLFALILVKFYPPPKPFLSILQEKNPFKYYFRPATKRKLCTRLDACRIQGIQPFLPKAVDTDSI